MNQIKCNVKNCQNMIEEEYVIDPVIRSYEPKEILCPKHRMMMKILMEDFDSGLMDGYFIDTSKDFDFRFFKDSPIIKALKENCGNNEIGGACLDGKIGLYNNANRYDMHCCEDGNYLVRDQDYKFVVKTADEQLAINSFLGE